MKVMIPATTVAPGFEDAELALEDEWIGRVESNMRRAPDGFEYRPETVARFYRQTKNQWPQLEAWHADENRQQWTKMIADVARRSGLDGGLAAHALDIGCGNGHDLRALRDAGVADLAGVEPSDYQRERMRADGLIVHPSVEQLPAGTVEQADLILCMDVMEHLPSPDEFLESWCSRARIGCTLIERTPVWDISSPLHLATNRGWHPGRTLEKWGWRTLEWDRQTGVTVWHRFEQRAPERTGIVQVIYQGVGMSCYTGMLQLMQRGDMRLPYVIHGDSLIPRGRSMAVTHWWRQTADDVCLMIDSDVGFTPEDVDRISHWCRTGYPVISAAFPLRDGSALGVQPRPDAEDNRIYFGADLEPMEIWRIQPGFLAIHRSVLDQLIPTTQLVHESMSTSFWPIFLESIETIDRVSVHGRPIAPIHTMLSEDWAFSARLNALGIKQYVARDIVLTHGGNVPVSVKNMDLIRQAFAVR